jgi:hypothetical protein
MLQEVTSVAKRIEKGERLMVSGDEALLTKLPQGTWVGGTVPYFMADVGVVTRSQLYATEIAGAPESVWTRTYTADQLQKIMLDAPENGYTLLILPFGSEVHRRFAREAPEFPETFMKPVIGWVSGVHQEDLGRDTPKVIDGSTGELRSDVAVAIHASLPTNLQALVGIINPFTPGNGDTITFEQEGFTVEYCLVNGHRRRFAEYLTETKADTRWPMVADYFGTNVNVSFRSIDAGKSQVLLYAPVFRNVSYRLASPLAKPYHEAYADAVRGREYPFACSCILNFIHGELEGKPVRGVRGPVTFGEIAHQLLNQTTVYLELAPALPRDER